MPLNIWIFCWCVSGVIAAMIASAKGRSLPAWFFIGFLFGPFGVVFAALAQKNVEVLENKTLNSGNHKKCPHCAELIRKEAKFCRYCQKEQPELITPVGSKPDDPHIQLQVAISKSDLDGVRQLLSSNFNIADSNLPMTHLEYAELYGNPEIIKLIREKL